MMAKNQHTDFELIDYYSNVLNNAGKIEEANEVKNNDPGEPEVAIGGGLLLARQNHIDVPLDILISTLAVLTDDGEDSEWLGADECREMIAAKKKQLSGS